jgi:phospholipid/cholesterol/gamma-HCH transport system permease protein
MAVRPLDSGKVIHESAVQIEKIQLRAHEDKSYGAGSAVAGKSENLRWPRRVGAQGRARMSAVAAVPASAARVTIAQVGPVLQVRLTGEWSTSHPRPSWRAQLAGVPIQEPTPNRVVVALAEDLGEWDSSLLLYVLAIRRWCAEHGAECELGALPAAMRQLLEQFSLVTAQTRIAERDETFVADVGRVAQGSWTQGREITTFVGELVLSALALLRAPTRFRWRDCLAEMQQCGARALPIVSLISLLTGLILAYQSAVLMRQFGADIYVADAVGLAMVREMGALMAAVILAGRTGAAFAATLGNMRANEEIDALATLGLRPVDFLVMPRLLALGLMMPLLTIYASALGIIGGMLVALGLLDIPPSAYWVQTQSALDLSDLSTGVIKGATFGVLVGLAGCHRGLVAERSAAGVGQAATAAVVTSLLLIVIADAIYAVLFNLLGL